jgi:hypothetical protein
MPEATLVLIEVSNWIRQIFLEDNPPMIAFCDTPAGSPSPFLHARSPVGLHS